MASLRDLSPTPWAAPGTAQLGLSVIQSNKGPNTFPLPLWISNYSPSVSTTVDLSSGFNAVPVLSANVRLWILIPPAGNAVTITLKGITGDTGLLQNPNGPIIVSLPAATAPTTIGITTGGAIAGCTLIEL